MQILNVRNMNSIICKHKGVHISKKGDVVKKQKKSVKILIKYKFLSDCW